MLVWQRDGFLTLASWPFLSVETCSPCICSLSLSLPCLAFFLLFLLFIFLKDFKEQLWDYNETGRKTQRLPAHRHSSFSCALLFSACRDCLFTNRRSTAALHQASLSVPFASDSICSPLVPMSVSVIIAIFWSFSLLLYLLWWSVISDPWREYYSCLGEPWTTPV